MKRKIKKMIQMLLVVSIIIASTLSVFTTSAYSAIDYFAYLRRTYYGSSLPFGARDARGLYVNDGESYTATINGKQIPHASYPVGSTWRSGYYTTFFDTGKECHGFGLFIYEYLFGNRGTVVSCNLYSSSSGEEIKSLFESFLPGTLVRCTREVYNATKKEYELVPHTMIIAGRDSVNKKVYLYHANWPSNNLVTMSSVTYDNVTNFINYRLDGYICPHNISLWHSESSTTHKGTCSMCHTVYSEKHYAQTAGVNVTCLKCGYVGSMDGLNSVGKEED